MNETTASANGLVRLGEAARRAGTTTNQLQYYLMVQAVEAAGRSAAGQRLFDQQAIKHIQIVKMLNELGYPLREARDVFMQGWPARHAGRM